MMRNRGGKQRLARGVLFGRFFFCIWEQQRGKIQVTGLCEHFVFFFSNQFGTLYICTRKSISRFYRNPLQSSGPWSIKILLMCDLRFFIFFADSFHSRFELDVEVSLEQL